jgi:SAM-dependent methyltransferase
MDLDIVHGMAVPRKAPHLGGYIPGGDPATQYPDLWRWMIETHLVETILDVGCGDGTALKTMGELGAKHTWGIDGVPQESQAIIEWDYEKGEFPSDTMYFADEFDLIWCCEFVEHIEERYVPNFLRTFQCSRRWILMTHGEPGQPGHHHVNNQPADYWKGALAAIGFQYDEQTTAMARGFASMNLDQWNHFRRSGLVFRRYGS